MTKFGSVIIKEDKQTQILYPNGNYAVHDHETKTWKRVNLEGV